MSEDKEVFGGDFSRTNLRAQVRNQMLIGAGVAFGLVGGVVAFIYALIFIGTLLPPESKEAVDPTPDSFSAYEITQSVDRA
ncbi:MAG: RC-LH1 core complex protein PufX [Paracoccaceae bacterium]